MAPVKEALAHFFDWMRGKAFCGRRRNRSPFATAPSCSTFPPVYRAFRLIAILSSATRPKYRTRAGGLA
jgi:hypothetical protein